MKGSMEILDRSGHTTLEWDTEKQTKNRDPSNGPLDPEFVAAEFDRLVSQGWLGVSTDPETKEKSKISRLRPSVHEQVTMIPPMAGG